MYSNYAHNVINNRTPLSSFFVIIHLEVVLQKMFSFQALLSRVGYTSEINHGVLMEMAEHKKDLEKKTKPILDTLRSYQDLPPVCFVLFIDWFFDILESDSNALSICIQDKALAALAIEDKKRQYAAAEKYLEEVLHSALTTPELWGFVCIECNLTL